MTQGGSDGGEVEEEEVEEKEVNEEEEVKEEEEKEEVKMTATQLALRPRRENTHMETEEEK